MFISYAQNLEDVMLWRAFSGVERGVYVDIGAQDPVVDSVSLAFHERGWRGVHVEPSAFYADRLREKRPNDLVIQAAVSDSVSLVPFFEIPDSGISTLDSVIAAQHRERGFTVQESRIPTVPLSAVFASCDGEVIHWLKIDIEGSERKALASWGPGSKRPRIVVVESTLPLSQIDSSDDWEPLLAARGYQFAYFDGLNRFYVANECPDLMRVFRAPPNVFDGFAVNGTASSSFHRAVEDRFKRAAEVVTAEHLRVEEDLRAELGRLRLALKQESARRTHVEIRLADREVVQVEQARKLEQDIRLLTEEARAQHSRADIERARLLDAQRLAQEEFAVALAESRARFADLQDRLGPLEAQREQARGELERLEASLRAVAAQREQAREELKRVSDAWNSDREKEASERSALLASRDAQERWLTEALVRLETHLAETTADHKRRETDLREELSRWEARASSVLDELAKARDGAEVATAALAEAEDALDRLSRSRTGAFLRLLGLLLPSASRARFAVAASSQPESASKPTVASVDVEAFIASGSKQRESMETATLSELLNLNDVDFVRAAYRAVLKREADLSGERNYVELMRKGHDKVRLLGDMALSDEGRRAGAVIPGLASALRRRRLARVPLLGPLSIYTSRFFGRAPDPDPVVAQQAQAFGMQRTLLDVLMQMQATLQRMQHQQGSLEQTLRRLNDRQSEMAVAVDILRSGRLQPAAVAAFGAGSVASQGNEPEDLQTQMIQKASAWKG